MLTEIRLAFLLAWVAGTFAFNHVAYALLEGALQNVDLPRLMVRRTVRVCASSMIFNTIER